MAYRIAMASAGSACSWGLIGLAGAGVLWAWGTYFTGLLQQGGPDLLLESRTARGTVGIVAALGYGS